MQPNPESALNEEAGKLLLEAYEDYFKHAQLMTQIHALKKTPAPAPNATATSSDTDAKKVRVEKENVPRNKAAAPTAASAANNKLKKSLKRL